MSTKLKNSDKISLDTLLQRELRFTESDRDINREGKLSPAQRDLLQRSKEDDACLGWGCGGVGLVLTFIIGVGLACNSSSAYIDETQMAVLIALCGITILSAIIRHHHKTQDLAELIVISTTGPVKRHNPMSRKTSTWQLVLDDNYFPISYELSQVLTDGEIYTLYYTPISRTLLSAEYMGMPESKEIYSSF